jgi:hypothetical protein
MHFCCAGSDRRVGHCKASNSRRWGGSCATAGRQITKAKRSHWPDVNFPPVAGVK